MKYVIRIFVLVCVGCTHAWGRGDLEKYGPFELALNSNFLKCDHDKTLDLDVSGVNVYFYDFRHNDVQAFPIQSAAEGILTIPGLETMRRFIIFVAGYKSNINKNTENRVRNTFRDFPNSYLIIIDHSPYTNQDHILKSYERAVKYVYYIGKALAEMLIDIQSGGISAKNMHCIGHSLGGQMLGYTGQIFFNTTKEKLWRITALDPAGPCFSKSNIEDQVRSGVAEYVEVYHCNAGGLGSNRVLGDIDFFLNKNGQVQPNCGTPLIPGIFDSSKAAKCSHRTCIQVWLATVKHRDWFLAYKCPSYKNFIEGLCEKNDVTLGGFWNPGNATGIYFFSTKGYDFDDDK